MFYEEMETKHLNVKGNRLAKKLPWINMVDNGIVNLKGDGLMCVYEFIAPDLASCSRSKIDTIASMFNDSLVQLGENWTVQFELERRLSNEYPSCDDWDNLTGCLVDMQREMNFACQKAHYANRYYLIFTRHFPNALEKVAKNAFFKSKDSKNKGSKNNVEADAKNEYDRIKDFKMKCTNIVSILSTTMHIELLNSQKLFTFLHSQVSINHQELACETDYPFFIDREITDMDVDNSMPLRLGKHYIPIVSIKSFPSRTYAAMLDSLNKADCEFRWSTRFMCYGKEETLKRLDNAQKRYHGQLQSFGQLIMSSFAHVESTRVNQTALAQENEVAQAKVDVTLGNVGFGDYCSEIMVWDEDLEEAKQKAAYVGNIAAACGFIYVNETFNSMNAWCAMQAGNIYANQREMFISTSNISHVIPFSSIWSGIKDNKDMKEIGGKNLPHIVCDTEFGIPFFLNLNVRDVGHTWISGKTGAGKSTLLAALEVQWLKYKNAQVIIFDKDRSARNLTMCTGGVYIEPGKDSVTFQPLREVDTLEGQNWATEFIELLLAEQKVNITPGMRKAIYDAIKILATKNPESRTLTSFCQYCDYQDPVSHINEIEIGVSPYVLDGQFGSMFDSDSSNLSLSSWTMIEMGTLMNMGQAAVAPALDYLFMQCEKRFDGRPTLLVLDEAWIFIKNKIFAKKIVDWLKTLRKKHVFVVFATQELEDAINSEIASTLISQCPSKIFLADEDACSELSFGSYQKFGLEPGEIQLLTRLIKKRDYFYKSTLGTRRFQLGLDEMQLAIMTNSISDHQLLDKIEKQYGKNTGKELVEYILDAKGVPFRDLLPDVYKNQKYKVTLGEEK